MSNLKIFNNKPPHHEDMMVICCFKNSVYGVTDNMFISHLNIVCKTK